MNGYVRWFSHRGEPFDDGAKGVPEAQLGRAMIQYGKNLGHESELGQCLVGMFTSHTRRHLFVCQADLRCVLSHGTC